MLNLENLPTPLRPYYKKLQEAETESAALFATLELIREHEKLPKEERERVEKLLYSTPITYTKH